MRTLAREARESREQGVGIVAIGSTLDPESRTLPVLLAVENTDGSLKIGQFAQDLLKHTTSSQRPGSNPLFLA